MTDAKEPSSEARAVVDRLERDDDKQWDEDFKLGLATTIDAYAARKVAEERERCAKICGRAEELMNAEARRYQEERK